jgi:Ca2+-binding EF-hand superfamily protein
MSKINLTDEQLEEAKKVWAVYDKDNNGYLDKEEMKNFLVDFSQIMCNVGAGGFTEEEIDEIIKQTDKNGDGKVDYEEFAESFLDMN